MSEQPAVPTTPKEERVPILDPLLLLSKSRAFVAAIVLLVMSVLMGQVEELQPLLPYLYPMVMGIIGLVFFKDTAENVRANAVKDKEAAESGATREELTSSVYDELDRLIRGVLFGSSTTDPETVKRAIAQGVAKAEAQAVKN